MPRYVNLFFFYFQLPTSFIILIELANYFLFSLQKWSKIIQERVGAATKLIS